MREIMLNIKILGSGCAKCKRLEQVTRKAVDQQGLAAEFEMVTSMEEIMKWPILSTPGLVIQNELVSSGKIPTEAEVAQWIEAAVRAS